MKIVGVTGFRGLWAQVGVANFFLGQSIGIDEPVSFFFGSIDRY